RTIKMDVEVTHLVRRSGRKIRLRLRCIGCSRPVNAVRSHEFVDAVDWCSRAFEKGAHGFGVRRKDLVLVAIDERLDDTDDMCADGSRIGRTLLSVSRKSDRQHQRRYEKLSTHGPPPLKRFCAFCAFLWQEQIRERRLC